MSAARTAGCAATGRSLAWLAGRSRTPTGAGSETRSRRSRRWKIFDNLRRSLFAAGDARLLPQRGLDRLPGRPGSGPPSCSASCSFPVYSGYRATRSCSAARWTSVGPHSLAALRLLACTPPGRRCSPSRSCLTRRSRWWMPSCARSGGCWFTKRTARVGDRRATSSAAGQWLARLLPALGSARSSWLGPHRFPQSRAAIRRRWLSASPLLVRSGAVARTSHGG